MLPTEPIFCHPYTSDDPLELSVCDFCGAPADKAIHDRRHASRWDLWGGRCWWPHERHIDGTVDE